MQWINIYFSFLQFSTQVRDLVPVSVLVPKLSILYYLQLYAMVPFSNLVRKLVI